MLTLSGKAEPEPAKTLVAIVDSGMDYDYVGLKPYISEGASGVSNCMPNATWGYNFLDDNNNPVNKGEAGELTVTTLGVEGMPLIRFKTGDICKAHYEKCSCGRTTLRISPILGRKQQMIKYKGTTLYPPAMNDVLNGFENIESYIIEIFTNDIGTDEIVIKLAVKEQTEAFLHEIKDHFRAKLRVTPKIEFTTKEVLHPMIFNPMSRKPLHFFDYR